MTGATGEGAGTAAERRLLTAAEMKLRAAALAFPDAYEEFPWGHRAIKVKKKGFAYIARDDEGLSLSVKLPLSSAGALMLPFASPTGYGLGRSGWVTARFLPGESVPVPVLCAWIDESYRAIAPKALAKRLNAAASAGRTPPRRSPPSRRSSRRP